MLRNFLYTGLCLLVAGTTATVEAATKDNGSAGQPKSSVGKLLPRSNVTLRSAVLVEGNFIRLSDLFENAGKYAEAEIAYAPQPGKRAVFDARWLYRVARAYKLSWRPLSLKTRAIVERASHQIDREEIEDHLISALRDNGVTDKFEIDLGNRSLKIYVADNESGGINVEGMSVDRSTGRFSATLVTSVDNPGARRIRLTGRVHKLVSLPVLGKRFSRRSIIRKHHIEWKSVRERRISPDTITEAEQLVGMAAKRLIRAGAPIRSSQIQHPVLVAKGGLVTIFLNLANMNLTAQGRALEDGSKGDIVRITNSHSKKVVEAKVTGVNAVKVSLIRQIALN